MTIELFVYIISFIVLIVSLFMMFNIFGQNIILTLPGYFYIHFLIFIFLGSPIIFINTGMQNYLYIISTHLVLVIFPLGILITNKLMLSNYPVVLTRYLDKHIIDRQTGDQFMILYISILCISIAITLLYFSKLEIIPFNYLLTSISDKLDITELAKLRESSTTTFNLGKLHRYKFFMAQMIPLLVILAYLKSKLSNTYYWHIQFYLLTIFALYRSVVDLQKAPIIHFILLIFLISWIYHGKVKWRQVGILITSIVVILCFMYYYIMGVNEGSYVELFKSIGNRVFLSQSASLYHYYSIFPSSHDFLYGTSFPNPGGIFNFENFPITRWVFVNGLNRNWEIVGTANSAFIGEIYANFDFPIMVLTILLFSIFLQYIQIKFTTNPRTLLYTVFYAYFVFLSGQFAMTGLFVVAHLYLVIFLFTALFFIDGYKILLGVLKRE